MGATFMRATLKNDPDTGNSGANSQDAHSAYLRRIGDHPTFGPERELQEAVKLRQARVQRWTALLAYPPLVASIRALIDERLTVDAEVAVELDELERAAEELRLRRTLANQSEFNVVCERVSERLVDLDLDGTLAELLVADLDRIAAGERDGLTLAVSRMPTGSRLFRSHHARVRAAAKQVRELTHKFAKANLRLVVSLARRFARGRMNLEDLIQEGNIGLLKAIGRYDHRRGFRFSTYAAWWIRHSISRAIYNKGLQVRLPVHVHDIQQKLVRLRRSHELAHGREPTVAELAAATGIPAAKIEMIANLEFGPLLSLDAPASAAGAMTARVELLEDEDEFGPDAVLEANELDAGLDEALASLQPMEADIVRRRYGLEGVQPETLRELGERYALSRERIRQLQARAVHHMREEFSRLSLL
jgi:RNA polymerase primary sigma factor